MEPGSQTRLPQTIEPRVEAAPLDLNELHLSLAGMRFDGKVRWFEQVDSTNAQLLQAAAAGAAEGTVFVGGEQTAGRGRGGHAWHSAAGDGLYVSVLAAPPLALDRVLWISLATGLAAQRAIASCTGVSVDIRWPNDLLAVDSDGTAKKCGGILVETAVDRGALRYAVIGIGLNVGHVRFPAELAAEATSLRLAAGATVARQALLAGLLRALDLELAMLEAGDPTLMARFAASSTWVRGKAVRVDEDGGYTGVTAGLNAAGFLLVRENDGRLRTVRSGGVRPQ